MQWVRDREEKVERGREKRRRVRDKERWNEGGKVRERERDGNSSSRICLGVIYYLRIILVRAHMPIMKCGQTKFFPTF